MEVVEVAEGRRTGLKMYTDSRFSNLCLVNTIMCFISISNPEYTLGNGAISNGIFEHGYIISIF